jgi:LacI family transcriptional regulator
MWYKATLTDITRELNTTAATVSMALSNQPGISGKTKNSVHLSASKLNYKRKQMASALRLQRGKADEVKKNLLPDLT